MNKPIDDIAAARKKIFDSCGREPNQMVIGLGSLRRLIADGRITDDMIEEFLKTVENIPADVVLLLSKGEKPRVVEMEELP